MDILLLVGKAMLGSEVASSGLCNVSLVANVSDVGIMGLIMAQCEERETDLSTKTPHDFRDIGFVGMRCC